VNGGAKTVEREAEMRRDGFGVRADNMAVMSRFYRDVLRVEIKESKNASNLYLDKERHTVSSAPEVRF